MYSSLFPQGDPTRETLPGAAGNCLETQNENPTFSPAPVNSPYLGGWLAGWLRFLGNMGETALGQCCMRGSQCGVVPPRCRITASRPPFSRLSRHCHSWSSLSLVENLRHWALEGSLLWSSGTAMVCAEKPSVQHLS